MTAAHGNTRLEALSDGVFAIAMTLLILDVRLPATASVANTQDLWRALGHLAPTVFAFLLSFTVILITWVNHHAALEFVHGSSPSFMYANGFLLLTVVTLPFPATLLGEFLWTDHAAPAVVLYNAVLATQSIAWILVSKAALADHLTVSERATATVRESGRRGYYAFALYALLTVLAVWFPLAVAIATTVSWLSWLAFGIRLKRG
jgi:uncharacterized membrane protein